MRIAVLDDDSARAELVCETLSAAGHVCHVFDTGRELVRQLRRQTFDLLVLDWDVRDMSGEEVLLWVRQSASGQLPVLFMTRPGTEADLASILNTGADDYVVKPVSSALLLARVTSLLRRAYHLKPAAGKEVFGEFEFDLGAKHVVARGVVVAVTQKEFDLALLLFQHLSRPLSRAHILDVIWKQAVDIPSRTMDTHMSMLRSKLGLRPERGYRLTPIYGYGYRLERLEADEARPGAGRHAGEHADNPTGRRADPRADDGEE
ncbi:response regulator transcription factor [Paraburkholderia sp. BCC1886]|uniref:response regulator transcription factor n=1 Tax=Paraburkholderia sp. BCC1886 TaxID=2562670 RepID=UPI0011845435|nr:response regulator transcription factor [Paraburkholderia sp. BCC1886]